MKARFVMVMVLALGVFGASSPVFADCPNVTASCAWGATGWQGTCYHGPSWTHPTGYCGRCGPVHCPNTNGYGAEQMPAKMPAKTPAIVGSVGACVQKLIAKGAGSVYHGCFNIHLNDPVSNDLKGAFVGACDAHNICYHVPGIKKPVCDAMFVTNMMHVCDSYYKNIDDGGNEAARTANGGMWRFCLAAAPVWTALVNSNIYNQDQDLGKQICK